MADTAERSIEASESRESIESIRRLYFGQGHSEGWCNASEKRLSLKLIEHKPAGISRHFHLLCLVDLLNHVYEDEKDLCFEDVLNEEHLRELKKRRSIQKSPGTAARIFPPSYSIRPSAAQIEQKLTESYDMAVINDHELVPSPFLKRTEFVLPDFNSEKVRGGGPPSSNSSVIGRDEANGGNTSKKGTLPPPPLPTQKEQRKRRRAAGDSPTADQQSRSSRSSTPSSVNNKRLRH